MRNEDGAVLVMALGIMVALLLIAAASSIFTRGDQRLTVNLRDGTQALFAAEAGIEWAHNRLRGASASLYLDPFVSLSGAAGSLGSSTFVVDVGTRSSSGRRNVTSTGRNAGIERVVTAGFRRFNLDPAATSDCLFPGDADSDGVCDSKLGVVSNRDLFVSAGSLSDSFHGNLGAYSAGTAAGHGNLATNGNLTLSGSGTVVRGGVYVGRSLSAGSNTLEQVKRVLPVLYLPPLPSYSASCDSHTNPALVDCNPPYGTVTSVLAGSPPDQTLTVGSSQTICMPPGTYCFRQIVVQQGGKLRFMDPATGQSPAMPPTVLQLGTPASGGSSLDVAGRLEYGTGIRPNAIKIFSRGNIVIAGWTNAGIWGLIYAPASTVSLNTGSSGNRADFHGVLYANQVTLGGGPVRFHVDEDATFGSFCSSATDPTCLPAFVVREEWREVRY